MAQWPGLGAQGQGCKLGHQAVGVVQGSQETPGDVGRRWGQEGCRWMLTWGVVHAGVPRGHGGVAVISAKERVSTRRRGAGAQSEGLPFQGCDRVT